MKIIMKKVFILEAVLVVGIALLLSWRIQVGLTRFFDVDEFTHLHWAAAMVHGSKPYIDFFTFFTPGFYWFLAPFFWIFSGSVSLFIAVRVVAIIIFFLMLALIGVLFGMLRNRRYLLIPVILLAFLPMPYDKFLELRPDNLATMLGLAGVVIQVWALLNDTHKKVKLAWGLAGFAYGWAAIVLVKMLPFVGVGCLIAILDCGILVSVWKSITEKKRIHIVIGVEYLWFIAGLCIPVAIFALWAISLGNLSTVIYSLTKMPFESNNIGHIYIMEPHLFFFPNASFYGGWGITMPLILNNALWAIGAVVGVYRFFTPYIAANGNRKKVLAEVLVSLIFVLSVVGYVNFFPLKHSQYLIPIAIFIAFYAGDIFVELLKRMEKSWGIIPVIFLLCFCMYGLWQQTIQVNQSKLTMSNTIQLQQLKALKLMIPASDEVFDLEGRMIYWKDPYYICCLPIGSFVSLLSRQPPPISQVLEARKVPYIFQGDTGRLWEFNNDLPYITAHYTRVPGWGDALWKRNTP